MHDTAPFGGVTSSPPPSTHHIGEHAEGKAEHQPATSADERHRPGVDAGAVRELLRERVTVRVEQRRHDEADERADEAAGDRADKRPHGAAVYGSAGDVDEHGDVVDRLRDAISDERPELVDDQLEAVRRMIARQVPA
jgi:hypothetical protein